MNRLLVSVVLLSALLPLCLDARAETAAAVAVKTAAADTSSEQGGVRETLAAMGKFASANDAAALSALWDKDGTYTDDSGETFQGREAIKKRLAAGLSSGRSPRIQLKPSRVTNLSDTIALAEGTVYRGNTASEAVPETRYSIVLTKQSGKWLVASATETPVVEPAPANPLGELSWMVGDWKAEREGKSLNLHIDWAANKNFLRCTYEINSPGKPAENDLEIIGYDPRMSEVQSWNFDSNGSVGESRWQRKGNTWEITSSKVGRDGTTVTARKIITVNGNTGFTWQAVDRSEDGVPLPDTAELPLTRVVK